MNVKGPTLVHSTGGRFVLEDDGETPDIQDAMWVFPGATPDSKGFVMNAAIREANAGRSLDDTASRGQLYLGTKGSMVLAGNWEVFPENKSDPVNDIPRFMGHPVGGPVYTDTKPSSVDRGVEGPGGGVRPPLRHRRRRHHGDERAGLDQLHQEPPEAVLRRGGRTPGLGRLPPGEHVAEARPGDSGGIPDKEVVIGDKEAAAMCVKPYRAPWDKELRSVVTI